MKIESAIRFGIYYINGEHIMSRTVKPELLLDTVGKLRRKYQITTIKGLPY